MASIVSKLCAGQEKVAKGNNSWSPTILPRTSCAFVTEFALIEDSVFEVLSMLIQHFQICSPDKQT